MNSPVRILIADRAPLYREGLRLALKQSSLNYELLEAERFGQVHGFLRTGKGVDLLLLDSILPQLNSFGQLHRLSRKHCVPTLLLSSLINDHFVRQVFISGCQGVLMKSSQFREVYDAITTVSGGGCWRPELECFDRQRTAEQVAADAGLHELFDRVEQMSSREKGILRHLADGLMNKQIADRMSLTEATVKGQLTIMYKKLQVNNRTRLAIKLSQLPPDVMGAA